jgi:hypothetical protein
MIPLSTFSKKCISFTLMEFSGYSHTLTIVRPNTREQNVPVRNTYVVLAKARPAWAACYCDVGKRGNIYDWLITANGTNI